MKNRFLKNVLIVFAALCPVAVILLSTTADAVPPQHLIVPAYYDDTAIWNQTYSSLTAGDIVIINPDSGVGSSKSAAYTGIVSSLNSRGIIPAGYVYTSYGARASSEVKSEIDKYFSWYGVTSIFFDEGATGSSYLAYYKDLYDYVKSRGGTVILNPGTVPDEGYMAVSDIVTDYEDSYSNYVKASFPAWTSKYSASKLANMVYGCPAANLGNAVSLSRSRNAGYVYITDISAHQWSYLPSYLGAEKALLGPTVTPSAKPTAAPTTTPAAAPSPTITPTATPDNTDYKALYEAAMASNAQKDNEISALGQQMAAFKAGLQDYINTH